MLSHLAFLKQELKNCDWGLQSLCIEHTNNKLTQTSLFFFFFFSLIIPDNLANREATKCPIAPQVTLKVGQ